jgi:parallel beta-helix repeat protein
MSDSQVLYVGPIDDTRKKVVVAAYDYTGDDVDYYCTGTQDQGMINTALAYANEVELSDGPFYLNNNIVLEENSILKGRGDATVLYVNKTTSPSGVINTSYSNCKIRNLQLVRQDNIAGFNIEGVQCDNIFIDNVLISGGIGSVKISTASGVLLSNSVIKNFAASTISATFSYGVYCQNVTGKIVNNTIYNSATAYGIMYGIYMITCSGVTVHNNDIYDLINGCEPSAGWAGQYGISEVNGFGIVSNNRVSNFQGYGGQYGISGSTQTIVTNNVVRDFLCPRGESGYGILVNSSYCQVMNNKVSNIEGVGIRIVSGTNTIVAGNSCVNNGQLIDRGGCESSSTSPTMFGETGVTSSGCTWEFTSTGPYGDWGQYRFSKTIAAGTRALVFISDNVSITDTHGLVAGTQYEFNGWLKCPASASCGYQGLRFTQVTTGGGTTITDVVTIATTGWQSVAVTATIYTAATMAYIGILASTSLPSTHVFDVDSLRLFPVGVSNVNNTNFSDAGTNTGSVNSWI